MEQETLSKDTIPGPTEQADPAEVQPAIPHDRSTVEKAPDDSQSTSWSELYVRSEEVREIIGRPPPWLVRWGVTAFFVVLALILFSTVFIRYPEVIEAPIRLTAVHAPQILQSRIDGRITRLLVNNNEEVNAGQILAWMESTADHEEVIQLGERISKMRNRLIQEQPYRIDELSLGQFRNLGELQSAFQGFEQSWREFKAFLPDGYHDERREILQRELEYTRQLLANLQEQKAIYESDHELARAEYEMQKQLADRDFIAPIEIARTESDVSSRRQAVQQVESSIINNYLSQTAKMREIMELNRQAEEQTAVFLQELNILISAIDEWKRTHVITAPFGGNIVYTGVLQENQTIRAGQELFYVQPDHVDFFGELAVSQRSFGKIEEGQQVLVRFSGYPHHEFGSIYGEIDYFSDFPVRDSLFYASVKFSEGLLTNYGMEIPPRSGMTGRAEIITQDMSLLERVYNNITKELR